MEKLYTYKYKGTKKPEAFTRSEMEEHLEGYLRLGLKASDYEIFEITEVSLGRPKLSITF
jgi:hypothetical protein